MIQHKYQVAFCNVRQKANGYKFYLPYHQELLSLS